MKEAFCVRCNRQLTPDHINTSFYVCFGVPEDPHPDVRVTDKLIEDEYEERFVRKNGSNGNGKHSENVPSAESSSNGKVKA